MYSFDPITGALTKSNSVKGTVVQVVSFDTSIVSLQNVQSFVSQQDYIVGLGAGKIQKTITPKYNNSWFEISVNWFGEVSIGWNMLFNVLHNATRVNTDIDASGLSSPLLSFYQNNFSSTPECTSFSCVSKLPAPRAVPVTFSLACVSSVGGNQIYTNKTKDYGASQTEKGTSSIIIKEIAQ